MQITGWIIPGALLAALAGCGDTAGEQALAGAGAGLATAVVLDGEPFTGAVVGAAGNLLYCQTNPGKCN